ncbi:MAG: ATP-dependent DNA helicase [Patescibacteria group bacterium]
MDMQKGNQKFEELYAKLNPAQKEAVDTIEGPVMVVAGPGTGKTQILTLRIANILKKTDAQPENILALTFTESGTTSMRRRLVEIIGSPAYGVVINTFHGFCNDVIKNYPEEFPRIIGSQHITEVDQIHLVETIIESSPLEELKPFGDPFYYLRGILSNINKLKQEGINPERFSEIVKKEKFEFEAIPDLYHTKGAHAGKMKGEYQKLLKQIRKNEELADVFRIYQKELAQRKYYDYSDMIMEVFEALERNNDLLLMLQEKHQYMLVDEHQDTNNAQNKILELLANYYEHPNIFVVGDEKQAIFRFQGASLENFLYFKKKYPDAKLITLEENYRSTQTILDSAHSLIEGEKRLKTHTSHGEKKLSLYAFSRPEIEYFFLGKHIAEQIEHGVHPHEIAVIYRDNRDAFPVAHIFEKYKIPFIIESDQDVLGDIDIRKFILLLRAVHGFGSNELFFEAMHIDFLKIDPADIYVLIDRVHREKMSLLSIIQSPEMLDTLGLKNISSVKRFFSDISGWKIKSKNIDIVSLFETIVRESGFLSHILSLPDSVEKMDKLITLFDQVKSMAEVHRGMNLELFISYIDTLLAHGASIKKSGGRHITSRVRCMTAHRAKGLEFEYVYIVNAYDGHWGNKRKSDTLPLVPRVFSLFGNSVRGSDIDDERRLFYVALTRAKKEVYISYARTDESGKEKISSQFLSEIKSECIAEEDAGEYEEKYNTEKSSIFSESFPSGVDIRNKDFIREIFMKNGLSVTGLNNYLRCPWQYFYTNLLRIPKAIEKHQMYGIAMHGALKDFFENLKVREVGKDFLLQKFEFYLNRQPLSKNDYTETLERGREALRGYFEFYKGNFYTRTLTEFSIQGALLTPDVRLTGIIDKMEILDDEGHVNVVDYKTGKPKSRGVIEGTTKSSDGDIKRQLAFYFLLLDLYKDGEKFRMVSGDIDFVEPDEKGRYKKERFEITNEDVEELKKLILKVSQEILDLSFWDRFCDDPKCEFCELRRMM